MSPRYAIYTRKSSESEDRQVLSIESQIKELNDLARIQGLPVSLILSEARSAKAPGRPTFGELLKAVSTGEMAGILCWKLDRLARNPVDGAALIWAMEEGRLSEIVTPGRTFSNTGNDKFWMQLEFGMAKKYVDDLSDNVKRGNRAKLARGWLPGPAPIGYLNDRADKTIVPDPQRFQLIRQIWDDVLEGVPVAEVLRQTREEWRLTTPPMGRLRGRKALSRSAIYRLLTNPFYFGLISRNGDSYPGAHEPMITESEFQRVQEMLGRPSRPPRPERKFTYTGLIRCGECGLSVTAEEKTNRFGSRYVYYHCTRRRMLDRCQQPSIRLEQLDAQIQEILRPLNLSKRFEGWARPNIQAQSRHREQLVKLETDSLNRGLGLASRRLAALTDLQLDHAITEAEFLAKRRELVSDKLRLEAQLAKQTSNPGDPFEPVAKMIFLAKYAANRFQEAAGPDRRAILTTVCSNLFLKDRILLTQLKTPFQLLSETASHPNWRSIVDGIRTWFMENPDMIQWPKFLFPDEEVSKKK